MRLIFTLLIVFILTLSDMSYADLYMYVDENGSIFFTDTPTHGGYIRIKETTPKPTTKQSKANIEKNSEIKKTGNVRKIKANKDALYKRVQHTAKRHDIDPDLVWAIIKMESNFNSDAVSPKGAAGLMQLMPSTAKAFAVSNPFNPHQNIEGGTRYLRYLLAMFNGDLKLSLAAYNAGENTVLYYKNIPPFLETRGYVNKVLSFYKELKYKQNSEARIRGSDF